MYQKILNKVSSKNKRVDTESSAFLALESLFKIYFKGLNTKYHPKIKAKSLV